MTVLKFSPRCPKCGGKLDPPDEARNLFCPTCRHTLMLNRSTKKN